MCRVCLWFIKIDEYNHILRQMGMIKNELMILSFILGIDSDNWNIFCFCDSAG
jgi:hypothetical protein